MTITSETMFDILARPTLQEQGNAMRLFQTTVGDIRCLPHAEELPEEEDYVEILDLRKGDKCCVCGK